MTDMRSSWFTRAFGVAEADLVAKVQSGEVPWDASKKKLNGRHVGDWSFETLDTMRRRGIEAAATVFGSGGKGLVNGKAVLKFDHVKGDAQQLHLERPNCMFQVASQFNCLEFISPASTPENGITDYSWDHTQGPVCAIQCPAAAFFRNYLVPMKDGIPGQTHDRQLNALSDLETELLKLTGQRYWNMHGGYLCMPIDRLQEFNGTLEALRQKDSSICEHLKGKVRIGVGYGSEVFSNARKPGHLVGQAFCSAPAITYSSCSDRAAWMGLSRLILEAEYEATLWASVIYMAENPSVTNQTKTYLTSVGGGVFGNSPEWIAASIRKALDKMREHKIGIHVSLVHFQELDKTMLAELEDIHEQFSPR
ncbi:hypothetical protein DIPPA_24487 [Diplonema papillatum]|nr:hypothetical protein DIPPA_24487 [Diplonema papillatum]